MESEVLLEAIGGGGVEPGFHCGWFCHCGCLMFDCSCDCSGGLTRCGGVVVLSIRRYVAVAAVTTT